MHNDINLVILQYMLVYSDNTGEVLLAMRTFVLHRNAVMLLLHVIVAFNKSEANVNNISVILFWHEVKPFNHGTTPILKLILSTTLLSRQIYKLQNVMNL